jgi:hypothetical protein
MESIHVEAKGSEGDPHFSCAVNFIPVMSTVGSSLKRLTRRGPVQYRMEACSTPTYRIPSHSGP